jgi:hypothetical protein
MGFYDRMLYMTGTCEKLIVTRTKVVAGCGNEINLESADPSFPIFPNVPFRPR